METTTSKNTKTRNDSIVRDKTIDLVNGQDKNKDPVNKLQYETKFVSKQVNENKISQNLETKKIIPGDPKFQLAAKNLYLEYSGCNLEFPVILSCLRTKLFSYVVEDYILRRRFNESNKNPTTYVYLKLKTKANIVSSSYLDLIDEKNN